jgi:CO/xanthine dehydrogenase Mo-binding subunit
MQHERDMQLRQNNSNHKVVCAVDRGPAVYPDAVTAQMEGATIMALTV